MTFSPTRSDLERFLGPSALPEWVDAMARLSPILCKHYGFTRIRWVHFIGQIAAETNGLSIRNMTEDMNYTTAARIIKIFRYRLNLAIQRVNKGEVSEPKIAKGSTVAKLAQACVRQPVLLANIVYGGRDGTPWMMGSRYLGRGPLQTTHLNNYRRAGNEVAKQPDGGTFDLVANPELLSTDPELGVRVAFAEWRLKGLNTWADQDDVDTVSDVLNTGNPNDNVKPHNPDGRRRWVAKAKVIWPAVPSETPEAPASEVPVAIESMLRKGAKGEEVLALQKRLRELGYHPGAEDGVYGLLTERAVVTFEAEHGLKVDGIAGPKTLAAMKDSAPADLGERAMMTAQVLKERGSTTVWWTQAIKRGLQFMGIGTGSAVVDTAAGTGVVDSWLATLEWLRGVGARSSDLLAWALTPKGLLICGIALSCAGLYYAVHRVEQARVEDAQSGANLGR